MSLDLCDFLALESGYGDLFLCESFDYREAEHENGERYFFHSNLFYDGTVEDREKLQGGVKKKNVLP